MNKILNLYQTCPSCQSQLTINSNSAKCPQCDFSFYLNPAPCVMVLIANDQDQMLWTIRGMEPQKGKWDLPGGFVNPNETIEQAAIREVKEELNLEVEITKLLGNVPDFYGPLGQPTLNFIFLVKVIGGELKPQDDVAEINWLKVSSLPSPIAFKNATIAIKRYQEYQRNYYV